MLLPELAAAFGPDLTVRQHGADTHAWDPLAHLRVTTTAMGEVARLVDAVAHRHAAVDGWRPEGVGTTRTGWCPGAGALSGWQGASRGPGGDAGGVARAMGERGRAIRAGAIACDVRGRAERGYGNGRVTGKWPRRRAVETAAWCVGWWCRDSFRWRGTAGGGIRWLRTRTLALVAPRPRRAAGTR